MKRKLTVRVRHWHSIFDCDSAKGNEKCWSWEFSGWPMRYHKTEQAAMKEFFEFADAIATEAKRIRKEVRDV